MNIYTSDRFFLPDQPIKVALIETGETARSVKVDSNAQAMGVEIPKAQPDVVRQSGDIPKAGEIDAEVRLWRDGTLVDITTTFLSRKPDQDDLQRLPTLAFEIPGKTLNPGIYRIEFSKAGQVVAGKEINVLSEEGYTYIRNQLRREEFFTESGPKFSIEQAWYRSWARLLNYAGVAAIPQIAVDLRLPPQRGKDNQDYESNFYWRMGSQRFEWMSFHLNRLILDRAVFGAQVHLGVPTTGNYENGEIRLRIKSYFPQSKLTRIPRQYADPINSVKYENGDEGFEINLNSSGDEDHITTAFTILHG